MTTQSEKYEFTPEFERALIAVAAQNPRLYGRVLHVLQPECMPSDLGKLAMQALHAISHDLGHGPDSPVILAQRLARWRYEGKVTHEQVCSIMDLVHQAEDDGMPGEGGIAAELIPILKRRLEKDAILQAMGAHKNRADMAHVLKTLEKARTLGQNDNSLGTRIGGGAFAVIDQLRHIDRLPTGIADLDAALGGGLPRASEGVLIGGPGDGKSLCLSQMSAYAAMCGLHVAYATLELPPPVVLARQIAAITMSPIDDIMGNTGMAFQARTWLEEHSLGPSWVKEFTAQVTSVPDIMAWVSECEGSIGRKLDLLVVDYADKLTDPRVKNDGNAYKIMEYVYESLRTSAVQKGMWCWTASQSVVKGRKDKGKGGKKARNLDLEDVADSSHKVRVADLCVTLNYDSENNEMTFYIAKNRTGVGHRKVGPMPCLFPYGLVAEMQREFNVDGRVAGEPILVRQAERALKGGVM